MGSTDEEFSAFVVARADHLSRPPLSLDQLQAIAEDDAWIGYEPPAGSAG
jgi:hypothetical protein